MPKEQDAVYLVEMKIVYVVKAPDKTAAEGLACKGETLDVLRAEVTDIEEANEKTAKFYSGG